MNDVSNVIQIQLKFYFALILILKRNHHYKSLDDMTAVLLSLCDNLYRLVGKGIIAK